jgi:hypothetical protein
MNSLKLAAILYKLSSLSRLAAIIFLLPALFGVQACRNINNSVADPFYTSPSLFPVPP